MSDIISHDVVIVGSGLARLRAAIQVAMKSKGKRSVGVI